MTEETRRLNEREEVEALLPWYVSGRLDQPERARIEAGIARYPELRDQLRMIAEDRDATIAANEQLQAPRSLTADRLLGRLSAAERTGSLSQLAKMRDLLVGPPLQVFRWAAVAGLIVLLVQSAAIGWLLTAGRVQVGYETASGPAPAASGGALGLVRFTSTATMEAVSEALSARGMAIHDGPKPGGLFVVRLGGAELTPEERAQRLAELRALRSLIELAVPASESPASDPSPAR